MRPDQYQQLQDLQEKLLDAVFIEADPGNWPGGDKLPMDLTRDERGDRYWCKKNAAATLSVLTKTMSLEHFNKGTPPDNPGDSDELDKEIAAAEKQAAQLLEKFSQRHGQQIQ